MKIAKLRKNMQGFSPVEVVLSLVIIAGIGFVGYGVATRPSQSAVHAQTLSDTTYRWGSFSLSKYLDYISNKPVAPSNLTNITAIAAGNASDMALDSSGNVWTWGDGNNGVLGNGSTGSHATSAVEVKGLPKIISMAESDNTDVVLAANGTVWGWGWNEGGQLCTGNHTQYNKPVEVTRLSNVASIAGAGPHFLYLLSNGTLEACGDNSYGELGNGTFTNSATPVTVNGLPASVASITAGQAQSTALLSNGQVWDWGYNKFGQLGNGTTTKSDVPVQAKLPSAAKQVYMGGDAYTNGQSLALLTDGQVWGWGNNAYGQLGNGKTKTNNDLPVQATSMPSGVTFTYVVSGGSHSLALDSNGNVWAWGNNDKGQVGNGTTSSKNVLTPVQVVTGADMISATADDSVAHTPVTP